MLHSILFYSVFPLMKRFKDMNPEEKKAYFREKNRALRLANPQYGLERNRLWRAMNPERVKQLKRESRLRNLESCKKKDAEKRAKFFDNIRARNLAYQRANRDKTRAWSKKWYEANKEKAAMYTFNRRGLIKSKGTRLSYGLIPKLKADQGDLCKLCACDLSQSGFHKDHIIPLAKGGLHIDSNIQLLCPACNLSKFTKIIDAI